MSRFRQAGSEPPYSEIKPERCPRHAPLNERQAKEARRAYMQDIPLPEEIADDLRYQQLRSNNKWR